MPTKLDRHEYERPPIVKAVVQVMMPWTHEEMLQAVNQLEESAEGFFESVERQNRTEFSVQATASGMSQNQVTTPIGLKCVDGAGMVTFVEANGIRSVHNIQSGTYSGRGQAMSGVLWWCEHLEGVYPSCQAVRVSNLVENRIKPDKPSPFKIQDYITPDFGFQDVRLNNFAFFEHKVHADLSKVAGQPMRGLVILRFPADPPSEGKPDEILLSIDVLDESQTPLSSVEARATRVKDVETHVFENCITNKTREIYGSRNA